MFHFKLHQQVHHALEQSAENECEIPRWSRDGYEHAVLVMKHHLSTGDLAYKLHKQKIKRQNNLLTCEQCLHLPLLSLLHSQCSSEDQLWSSLAKVCKFLEQWLTSQLLSFHTLVGSQHQPSSTRDECKLEGKLMRGIKYLDGGVKLNDNLPSISTFKYHTVVLKIILDAVIDVRNLDWKAN